MVKREGASGKEAALLTLLQQFYAEDCKVLVFCQSKAMLHHLHATLPYSSLLMSGDTPLQQRHGLVTAFGTGDCFVFLLTTAVGGLGLNLSAANCVVLYDVDWNPSRDEQAKQRCYRIGQQRPVKVYTLIAAGTIEEKVRLSWCLLMLLLMVMAAVT